MKKEESKMGRSKKEEKIEDINVNQKAETDQNANKSKSKKRLIAIISLFIMGVLIVSGIIIVPKVLENIEENSENEESNKITETIEVKVIPSYNEEAYVVEGIPDTVKVEITGKKKAVEKAKENSDTELRLDLSEYEPSKEKTKVKIKYNCPEKVECEVKPSILKVSIQDKVSTTKQVKYKIVENKLLELFNIKSVDLSRNEVVIKGSQDTLESISEVNVLIDINDLIDTNAGNFLQLGTRYVNNLIVVAYDKKGKEITNIDIVPSTMSAEIELTSNTKEVPLNLNFIGELATGRAIASITVNGTDASSFTTTIFGDETVLENIDSIPLSIDVDGQGNNGTQSFKVTLFKPAGVKSISDESVTVVLNFGEAKQKTIMIKDISAINVPNGLIANLASKDDQEVEVQVIGVESVLNQLDENNTRIYAYVDLQGLSEGPNSVEVKLDIKDPRLKYIITKKINVTLTKQ